MIKRDSLFHSKNSLTWIGSGCLLLYANSVYAIPTLDQIIENISKAVPDLTRVVTAIAYVMGMYFIIAGVMELKRFGEMRTMMSHDRSIKGPLVEIFVGSLLLYLPSTVRVSMQTFWTAPNPYGYTVDQNGMWAEVTTAAFTIIQLIGIIAFIRGLVMLTQLGKHGQATFGKAMSHLIAGILCIDMYDALQMLKGVLGLS